MNFDLNLVSLESVNNWMIWLSLLLDKIKARLRGECLLRASRSQYHQQYSLLNHDLGYKMYLRNSINIKMEKWIFKARAAAIDLNNKPWIKNRIYLCSLCNTQEDETVFHFLFQCSVLSFVQLKWLNCSNLNRSEFEAHLNENDWLRLETRWYRWELIYKLNFQCF